jgi:hypothetical protein
VPIVSRIEQIKGAERFDQIMVAVNRLMEAFASPFHDAPEPRVLQQWPSHDVSPSV